MLGLSLFPCFLRYVSVFRFVFSSHVLVLVFCASAWLCVRAFCFVFRFVLRSLPCSAPSLPPFSLSLGVCFVSGFVVLTAAVCVALHVRARAVLSCF